VATQAPIRPNTCVAHGRRIVRIGFGRRQIHGYATVGPAHRYISAAGYRPIVYGIPVCPLRSSTGLAACEGVTVPCSVQGFSVFPTDSATADGIAAVDMANERAVVARARRGVGATARRRYLEDRQAEVVDSVASTMRRRGRSALRLGSVGHGSGLGCVGGAGQPPVAAQ
jgi:hypothetical protein